MMSSIILILALTEVAVHGEIEWKQAPSLHKKNAYLLSRTKTRLVFETDRSSLEFDIRLYPDAKLDFQLKEAFFQLYLGPFDLRLGRQRISWGKSEGLFVADLVSPLDLREFLLQDLEDLKLPVSALRVWYYMHENFSLEGVWLPYFEPPLRAQGDSPWAFNQPAPPVPAVIEEAILPAKTMWNSELAVRINTLWLGADWALATLYIWDDWMVRHAKLTTDSLTQQPFAFITPYYHRVHVFTLGAERPYRSLVFRAEGAYYPVRYFPTMNPQDADMVSESSFLDLLIACDWKINSDWSLGTQAFWRRIIDHDSAFVDPQNRQFASMSIVGSMIDGYLKPSCFLLYGFEEAEYLLRLRMECEPVNSVTLAAGIDIIGGEQQGILGNFKDNDLCYLEVHYSF